MCDKARGSFRRRDKSRQSIVLGCTLIANGGNAGIGKTKKKTKKNENYEKITYRRLFPQVLAMKRRVNEQPAQFSRFSTGVTKCDGKNSEQSLLFPFFCPVLHVRYSIVSRRFTTRSNYRADFSTSKIDDSRTFTILSRNKKKQKRKKNISTR